MAKAGPIGSTPLRFIKKKPTKGMPTRPGGRKPKKRSRGQGKP
jgi:hypothetical protein